MRQQLSAAFGNIKKSLKSEFYSQFIFNQFARQWYFWQWHWQILECWKLTLFFVEVMVFKILIILVFLADIKYCCECCSSCEMLWFLTVQLCDMQLLKKSILFERSPLFASWPQIFSPTGSFLWPMHGHYPYHETITSLAAGCSQHTLFMTKLKTIGCGYHFLSYVVVGRNIIDTIADHPQL